MNKPPIKNKPKLYNIDDIKNHVDKSFYFIDKLFSHSTVNMIFSPPAQAKSIISLYMGLCIAKGSEFMGQKTKQANVLYMDRENNLDNIKHRTLALCNAHDIKLDDLPINFIIREGSLDSFFREQLKEIIKEKDIKVIFIDTIRRFGNFDENSSNDINEIYNDFFIPLMDEFQICFIFLHHTTKEGKYRGSGDLEAQVETAYQIEKPNKKDSRFTIKAQKTRGNELEKLTGHISFENEYNEELEKEILTSITIENTKEKDEEVKEENRYSEIVTALRQYMTEDRYYKNMDLRAYITNKKLASKTKFMAFLKWAVIKEILEKGETGYRLSQKFQKQISEEEYEQLEVKIK